MSFIGACSCSPSSGADFVLFVPLHEAKKLFAYVAGTCRARGNRGEREVKLMCMDVMKADLNVRCV